MDPNTRVQEAAAGGAAEAVPSDVLTARAIDRVLESEQAAKATLVECERQCAELLDRAREQHRAIAERARMRIVALHARAAKALEERTAAILERGKPSVANTVAQLSDPTRRRAALERLVIRLTGIDGQDRESP